jgi:hypothetical protein
LIIKSGSKDISVPAATYVSNLYVRKFKAGTPFLIVAGGKRGAINDSEVQGLEYDLSDDDRALLEPLGHNLIVKRRGFGTLLFSNNTAYQRINSALNNAHVRDNLSTIERDINRILFNFLFDFNDEITRIRIKTIVENYLDSVVNAKGLASYEVTFDSSNNGEDVLSANSAIIDIKVDFPRGIQRHDQRWRWTVFAYRRPWLSERRSIVCGRSGQGFDHRAGGQPIPTRHRADGRGVP